MYRDESVWENDLYRPLEARSAKSLSILLVPYFAWANRGPAAVSVWLPVASRDLGLIQRVTDRRACQGVLPGADHPPRSVTEHRCVAFAAPRGQHGL
jgi:hypothetical protein